MYDVDNAISRAMMIEEAVVLTVLVSLILALVLSNQEVEVRLATSSETW